MPSGPANQKDDRIHDEDVFLILAYDSAMLTELGAKENASPAPTVPDPTTATSNVLRQIREYLEGILSIIGGNPSTVAPDPQSQGPKFTKKVLKAYVKVLDQARKIVDGPNPYIPQKPPYQSDLLAWLRDYSSAIYSEIAIKSRFQPLRPIRRVPGGTEEGKITALMSAIANKL